MRQPWFAWQEQAGLDRERAPQRAALVSAQGVKFERNYRISVLSAAVPASAP